MNAGVHRDRVHWPDARIRFPHACLHRVAGRFPLPLEWSGPMNWLGLVLMVLAGWAALKVVGMLFKLVLWVVVIGAAYWFLAPHMGWPWPPFGAG